MAATETRARALPIVGVGASAGGLEAFSRLLHQLPDDCGMAFVFVQHLDRKRPSLLSSALARATRMVVEEARDGVRVEENHVYVIPADADLTLRDGALAVVERTAAPGPHLPIDLLFQNLAESAGSGAIGVLLSGTGTDGTEGLRAIRAGGGITFAQDPGSARFGAMTAHAIGEGVVDQVLTPEGIGLSLPRLGHHPYLTDPESDQPPSEWGATNQQRLLRQVLEHLRRSSGIDFAEYKESTVRRRLLRRMALLQVATVEHYVLRLQDDPAEAAALCKDLLIHVTGFFRDPEVFEALARRVLPEILARHGDGSPVRVWVPGCSTGEEAYSLAMMLREVGPAHFAPPIQIFGSDISAAAIARARAGHYPRTAVRGVPAALLQRYFEPVEGGYRVEKAIRELCVFVQHDITRDPPFAKLDLVSCRNLLIYFSPGLQRRVVPLFHYCLDTDGVLLLGRSESLSAFSDLFAILDDPSKVFVRKGASRGAAGPRPGWSRTGDSSPRLPSQATPAPPGTDLAKQVGALLVRRYAPPGAVINERMQILQIHGDTSPYLQLPVGQPNLNILEMARQGLLVDLKLALERARRDGAPTRREGIEAQRDGRTSLVNIQVIPLTGAPVSEHCFLVLFEPAGVLAAAAPGRVRASEDRQLARLQEEMAATKDYLQAVLDERLRINEALTATNEELISGNEELQSTVEELETAKEELQSTNEEITTVNDELRDRHQEMSQLNDDLVNLLEVAEIPIVIVGRDGRVRRFTPRASPLMSLLPGDIGRPITDLRPSVAIPHLGAQISEVLATERTKESDVLDREGRWHRMQLRPYRTADGRVDGVVLSLLDIDRLKHAVTDAEEALAHLMGIVETVKVPLVVLDGDLAVQSANKAFYEGFSLSPEECRKQSFFEIGEGMWNAPDLRLQLAQAVSEGVACEVDREIQRPPGNPRVIAVAGSVFRWKTERPMLVLTLVDITERTAMLIAAQAARLEAEQANRAKDAFLATLTHELRTPLASIAMRAALLQQAHVDLARARSVGEAIERSARVQSDLIEDLLDIPRVVSGKLRLDSRPVDIATVVGAAIETVQVSADAGRIELEAELGAGGAVVCGDARRLQQVFWNLLVNAVKFTPAGGRIAVTVCGSEADVEVRVADTGQGIAPGFLPQVFDRFAQAEGGIAGGRGGLGIGLALVRDLVRLHKGKVTAESPGEGQGATFTVSLPRTTPALACGDDAVEPPPTFVPPAVLMRAEPARSP